MVDKFPNLVKEIDRQVQEAQKVPNKVNPKKPTPRHIIIKMPKVKDKERILKAAREKQIVTSKEVPLRMPANFTREILQARIHLQEIFKEEKQELITSASKAII